MPSGKSSNEGAAQQAQEASEQASPQIRQASDKTIPGGRYIVGVTPQNPNGRVVNANGQPIEEEKA